MGVFEFLDTNVHVVLLQGGSRLVRDRLVVSLADCVLILWGRNVVFVLVLLAVLVSKR